MKFVKKIVNAEKQFPSNSNHEEKGQKVRMKMEGPPRSSSITSNSNENMDQNPSRPSSRTGDVNTSRGITRPLSPHRRKDGREYIPRDMGSQPAIIEPRRNSENGGSLQSGSLDNSQLQPVLQRSHSPLSERRNMSPRRSNKNSDGRSSPSLMEKRSQSPVLQSRKESLGIDSQLSKPMARSESNASSISKQGPTRFQNLELDSGLDSPGASSPGSISVYNNFSDSKSQPKHSLKLILKGLEMKSKAELLDIAKKMATEINSKNRIIFDTKVNEKWLVAELASKGVVEYKKDAMTKLQLEMSKMSITGVDENIVHSLLAFKEELGAAKISLEKHETNLMLLEKKRTVAEEEAAYLRTMLDSGRKNTTNMQDERIKELELQLQETLSDYTTLQTKVSQWARASKKHQDGRIAAEAMLKVLEEENQKLVESLTEASGNEDLLQKQLSSIGTGEQPIVQLQASVYASQKRITSLEENIRDAYAIIESLEKQLEDETQKRCEIQNLNETLQYSNQELKGKIESLSEFTDIVKKRSSFVPLQDARSMKPTSESKILNHELEVLKQSYEQLQSDHKSLQKRNEEYKMLLENSQNKIAQLESNSKEHQRMAENFEQLVNERDHLKQQVEQADVRIQQKQISIEMLEKHLGNSKKKVAILEQSVENREDLEDANEQLKAHNAELSEAIEQMGIKAVANQQKIQELKGLLGKTGTNNENTIIQNLQSSLQEAQEQIEVLTLQLEERTNDVEMLEQRISSSSSKKNSLATDMFTLKASTNKTQKSDIDELQKMYDDTIEELTALKREFSNATTTLAEQHIAIGKMESKLAENSENIEVLETEKAILNQKLALLQQIKSEYDIQTVQYEKMQQKLTEIETAMSVSMGSRSIGNEDGGQAHQQQLVSLKDTIAHMEHEMKLIRNENEKLSTQVKSRRDSNSYSTRIDQLETSLNVLLTQKEQMSKEIVQLRFVKEDYDEQVLITNDLESRLEELTRQIDVFKSQIEEKVDIIFQLESEMDQMEKDHDQHIKFLKEEQDRVLSEHEDHIAKLMDDIKFKENQLQFTEHQSQSPPLPPKDFSKSHDEISNLVSKLDAAEIELAELKIQMDPNANSRSINPISPEDDSFVNEHFLRLQHQKEMDKINEQVYNLESEIETLKLQLEKVTVESDSLKKKYETILRQNELLQNTVESKEAELKQLNDQLPQDDDFFSKKRHEEEMLQFQLRMEATLKELNSIESQINGFEEEKLAWSQKETEYTKLDSLYQQMLAEKEEQIEIFTYDLSLASERITKLQNQISSSDNAEDDVKSKSSDIITQLQNHCQELENQINDANQIIEDSDQQLEAYTHDLNQQQQVIDRMQIEIEKKTSRINDLLMNQNTVAKDSSSPKTPKLIALEQVVAEKEAHLHSIMEEMRILRQTNDEKGVRIQKLEEQLQERKFDIDRLKQELEKARNTQNSLKGGDTFKDSELKVKNEQLQELKSLVDELTLKVQKLAVENNETKIKLEKANALVEVLEQKKSELQLQAQELQNNNQELLEQVEYQAGIAEDALKQVDEYEDEILLLRKQNGTSAKISQVQAALERNSIGGQESDIRVEELELMNEQLMDKIASLSEKLAKQDANRISINPNMFLEQNQTEIDDLTAQLNEAISKIDLLQTEKFQLIDKIEDLQDHNHVLQQSLESK